MRLLFKQRFFSWFDSYDIYDENEHTVFTVEGKLAWGHELHILDADGYFLGMVKQRVLTFLPRFEFYQGEELLGTLTKEFTLFRPSFSLDFNGWTVQGRVMEWDYEIRDANGGLVATVSKELFHLTDTYVIDVERPENALLALMVVLSIDAEKCSRG